MLACIHIFRIPIYRLQHETDKHQGELLSDHVHQLSLKNGPDDPHQLITVRRRHIWSDTKPCFSKPYYNFVCPVKVIFVGEPAENEGGPKREFLCLALSAAIGDLTLFSGPARNRVILHSTAACIQQHFLYVGKLISMSLCQGGPGPACLASWCYNYLCFGIEGTTVKTCAISAYSDTANQGW